jgi:tRNA pseudouridine13 synthase
MSEADTERAVGMEWYATKGAPCPARVKASPEDFKVEEQLDLRELTAGRRDGYYPVYRVEKHSIDTMHMAKELGGVLKSRVSYAGLKDRKAVAIQYVTPTSLRSERPTEVAEEKFTARLVGYLPRPISRAMMAGNRFEVVLRECCARAEEAVEEALRLAGESRVPNYYGLQRFGASGAGTHRIGEAMVKREFEEAVRLMLSEGGRANSGRMVEAREALTAERYGEVARLLPPGRDVERRVASELSRRPGDWVGALRAVPIGLRRLYVHAYQSVIFNKTLSRALAKGEDISALKAGDNWAELGRGGLETSRVMGVRDEARAGGVPMVQVVGYAFRDYGSRFDACTLEALRAENLHPREFYVQEMQEVSAEGGFRRPHLAIKDASWNMEERTARLTFTLARGEYATVLLREIIKPHDPGPAGLT